MNHMHLSTYIYKLALDVISHQHLFLKELSSVVVVNLKLREIL